MRFQGAECFVRSQGLPAKIERRVEELQERRALLEAGNYYHYFQAVEGLEGAHVYVEGERRLMLATYSYLGLLKHPRVAEAAQRAASQYGTGTHGVRILGGTLDLHLQLERRLAAWSGREDAITFTSGYVTNLATISTLVGEGDFVLTDTANHASIVDGCLLSGATVRRFPHNNLAFLERRLADLPAQGTKLVVADGVFSMDGDILDLPAVVDICRRHGAMLMVDEAHSFGVLGPRGLGIEDHFGMPGVIDVKMGTLSKTLPGTGGFVAGDRGLVDLLRHEARGFVFSAAMAPPTAAAILAALEVLEEEGTERRSRLHENVTTFTSALRRLGFDLGRTETAIVPVIIGDERRTLEMVKACQEEGLIILPVLYPAVARSASRLRINVTSEHTAADITRVVEVLCAAGRRIGVIPGTPPVLLRHSDVPKHTPARPSSVVVAIDAEDR